MHTVDKKPIYVHLVCLVLTIAVGAAIYFIEGHSTQEVLAEQMLHREQVIVRSGAQNLFNFMSGVGRGLAVTASTNRAKEGSNESLKSVLRDYVRTWDGTPVISVTYLDKNGIAKINANRREVNDVDTDLADRDYYLWAKDALPGSFQIGRPVISRLGITKDEFVVPIAAPVYTTEGEFNGVLASVIYLDSMVEMFSEPLKISDNTTVHLLNSQGDFVFSGIKDLEGKDISEIFGKAEFQGKDNILKTFIEEFASANTEGKFDLVFPDILNGGKMTRNLLAYSSFKVDEGRSWTLIISTPANDAFLFTGPFYRDQIYSFVFIIIVAISFTIFGVTSKRLKLAKTHVKQ